MQGSAMGFADVQPREACGAGGAVLIETGCKMEKPAWALRSCWGLSWCSVGSEMPRASPLRCHGGPCAAQRWLSEPGAPSPGAGPGTRDPREEMTLLSGHAAWRRVQGQLKLLQAPLAKPLSTLSYGCSPQATSPLLEEVPFVTDIAYPAASHLCPELLVLSWHGGTAVLNALKSSCHGVLGRSALLVLSQLLMCCMETCSLLRAGARVTHQSSRGRRTV